MSGADWPRPEPYNPLSKHNLGNSVAGRLLEMDLHALPPEPFLGAGVYAIYYTGELAMYAPLGSATRSGANLPIYVGKAVPAGARKGAFGLEAPAGADLYNRLKDHAASLDAAQNLELQDFQCRYLVVDDIWIPLAESLLIARLKPLWNMCLDGFGNHDPGRGRHNQKRSAWDVAHPGRRWAERLADGPQTNSELQERVRRFLREAGLEAR